MTTSALVKVEESPVAIALDASSQALLELLPDAAAATRFKRVVIQALTKNPELLECTPESVVSSVFEAAAQGLEPTGAAGGAHLVPYNVKVSKHGQPDRWEKRAQLIPDYRGVVRMVTRPDPKTGRPSEVLSIEASVVKEGDEFAYQKGTDPWIQHVPALAADRSSKPTTHVYAVAQLRSGRAIPDVMDFAEVERIRNRGKKRGISPWDSDWDEMAKKTVVKRVAKLLPVSPEVRSILVREDELEGLETPEAPAAAVAGPRTKQLAARLRPVAAAEPEPLDLFEDDDAPVADEPTPDTNPDPTPSQFQLAEKLRELASRSGLQGAATQPQRARLTAAFAGLPTEVIQGGISWVFGHDRFTAAEAQAAITVADSLGDEAFRQEWAGLAG